MTVNDLPVPTCQSLASPAKPRYSLTTRPEEIASIERNSMMQEPHDIIGAVHNGIGYALPWSLERWRKARGAVTAGGAP